MSTCALLIGIFVSVFVVNYERNLDSQGKTGFGIFSFAKWRSKLVGTFLIKIA